MIKGSKVLRGAARYIPAGPLRPFGRPVALFFHGVAECFHDPRIEVNHHSAEAFCRIAMQLKRDFRVMPLASLDDALRNPAKHARSVFLMSDDGYANTLLAADILGELALPWSLFVSTEHIDTGAFNPLILARLFVHFAADGEYRLPHLAREVFLRNADDRARTAKWLLAGLKRLPICKARAAIRAMSDAFPAARLESLRNTFASERYLTWAEVETLHRRNVEIGAHAHWHWPMNACQSEEELLLQATLPREAIAAHTGRCDYFSYPFGNEGDVSSRARQAVRAAGYSHAFSTLSGTLRPDCDPWLLPRYGLRAEEPNLGALVPLLRLGNPRVARFSQKLAA
ncbi:MAG TPA: polysaccharide deacetylase family protein [Rhizomicrobium sp.]|jgi:peptidoglycan/xylan/chitin deacetylase (PgdA/CDA1 family)|nr:polysaccharide deacetylase family protein [Rhizomicrobium sp.]